MEHAIFHYRPPIGQEFACISEIDSVCLLAEKLKTAKDNLKDIISAEKIYSGLNNSTDEHGSPIFVFGIGGCDNPYSAFENLFNFTAPIFPHKFVSESASYCDAINRMLQNNYNVCLKTGFLGHMYIDIPGHNF